VLEASGGWEVLAASSLAEAGLPVAVVNPRQVRDFARAVGQLAKTDALDAQLLARFAEAVQPAPRPLPDAQQQALAAVLARRRQVLGMLTAERQRLGTARAPVRGRVQAHIRWLEQELADLDDELGRTIRQSPVWRAREALLRSVPGIGPTVALTLRSSCPSWGSWTASASPPWSASPRSTATAAPCAANARSGAAGPACAAPCTWPRSWAPATTRCCAPSTRACWRPASRGWSP
jgi:transposase